MASLRKPTTDTVQDPQLLLPVLLGLYEAIVAIQSARPAVTSIIDLGALKADPSVPPVGFVYEYTIAGSLKVRTRTAIYVVAA